jgi:hypothetical protein
MLSNQERYFWANSSSSDRTNEKSWFCVCSIALYWNLPWILLSIVCSPFHTYHVTFNMCLLISWFLICSLTQFFLIRYMFSPKFLLSPRWSCQQVHIMCNKIQCFQQLGRNSYITLVFFVIWQTYFVFSITVQTMVIFSTISAPKEKNFEYRC